MILLDLINRVKEKCPVFDGRVYGSAQLEEGLRQAENIPVPTAFIMVDGDFPEDNVDPAGAVQQTQERWTVVVVVSNKDDRRGQHASDGLHQVRKQLLRALLGWENAPDRDETDEQDVDNDWGPIVYRGGIHLDMNAARLWHQFSFGHTIIISAGRDYPELPPLKAAFRGGPSGRDNTHEPFYERPSGEVVPSPIQPPPRPKPPHKPPTVMGLLKGDRRGETIDYGSDPYGLGEDDPNDADT